MVSVEGRALGFRHAFLLLLARLLLKVRYVLIVGLAFGLLYFVLHNSDQSNDAKIRIVVIFGASLILFGLVDRLSRRSTAPYFWNFKKSERVARISELLRTCKTSLIAVAGTFDGAWESNEVIQALKQVPGSADIHLYYTKADGIRSGPFAAWLKGRDLEAVFLNEPKLKHRIIVDNINVRVEFNSKGHVPFFHDGRPAMFFYGEAEVAYQAMEGLSKALAKHQLEGTLASASKRGPTVHIAATIN